MTWGRVLTDLGYEFLLTRPLRDVTEEYDNFKLTAFISTHTPLAGRDRNGNISSGVTELISTHTPLAGRDMKLEHFYIGQTRFLLTRPLRDVT